MVLFNSAGRKPFISGLRNSILVLLNKNTQASILYYNFPRRLKFLFQGHIILTDFGLCKEGMEPEETTSTFCGTPEVGYIEILYLYIRLYKILMGDLFLSVT